MTELIEKEITEKIESLEARITAERAATWKPKPGDVLIGSLAGWQAAIFDNDGFWQIRKADGEIVLVPFCRAVTSAVSRPGKKMTSGTILALTYLGKGKYSGIVE
jgi:hypothetical protein